MGTAALLMFSAALKTECFCRELIVRLTEQSAEGDTRFLKARLRDPKIMRVVQLFLAYMKDQPDTVCVDGITPTSI